MAWSQRFDRAEGHQFPARAYGAATCAPAWPGALDKVRASAGEAEDPSALLWTRLGIALTHSSDALADEDLAKLARSLKALVDAAGTLADALAAGASG